jgi:hypothetical protein
MYRTTAAEEEVYAERFAIPGLIAAFTLHHLEKKVAADVKRSPRSREEHHE